MHGWFYSHSTAGLPACHPLGLVSFARSVLLPTWYQKLGQLATRGDIIWQATNLDEQSRKDGAQQSEWWYPSDPGLAQEPQHSPLRAWESAETTFCQCWCHWVLSSQILMPSYTLGAQLSWCLLDNASIKDRTSSQECFSEEMTLVPVIQMGTCAQCGRPACLRLCWDWC